jgi:hypothetical protein
MAEYKTFWGETHDNTYEVDRQDPPFDQICQLASRHLDFYAAAYYTSCADAFRPGGHPSELSGPQRLILEKWKTPQRLEAEWAEVQQATAKYDEPGRFVTFPGYEWQGDGTCGDHNVFHRREGWPIARVPTLDQLYEQLRGIDALAIPHHTGYRVGRRSPDWRRCDETLSPFVEIFSGHGCSETDEEWIGLRHNSHMGPGAGGGTYEDALAYGLHVGAICSTDNWGVMPGRYGRGLMGCLAEELTREDLWRAFRARRVYGVTGDRIKMDFTVNGQPMGSTIQASGTRDIRIAVRGSDAIDRIELLRNGRVLATHCHQGTWSLPQPGRRSRFKLRIEVGWGPRPNEMPVTEHRWNGRLMIDGGRLIGWEPCWISLGQEVPILNGARADFSLTSSTANVIDPQQNANVFEFEAAPDAPARLDLNSLTEKAAVADFARGSRILWYKDECIRHLHEHFGLEPGSHEREDPYYHMAHKAKIHRAIPEAGYTATFEFADDQPLDREVHYRVRVEQRNGQRAWSSPIWVRPDEARSGATQRPEWPPAT